MGKKQMIVWEVLLGDYTDAKPEDCSHGGVMVCNLPVRGRCFIESSDQSGGGDKLREAAKEEGRRLGISRPCVKGTIRASENVPSEWIFRALCENEESDE